MKRREFLKKGVGGTMAFALSGLIVTSESAQAAGNTFNYDFTAEGVDKTLINGNNIFTWALNDNAGPSGPGALGSGIIVTEGDTVNVTVTNNLDRNINFVVQGVTGSTPAVTPSNSRTYSFVAPSAGTYMYTDDVNGFIGKAMGLAGPLIVMPADGSQALTGPSDTFDQQYTMFMSDMDDRLNAAVAAGGTYNISDYEPNYYFANGLIFPDTKYDDETFMTMSVGDDVAVRFVNGGVIEYPMHFHGYHVHHKTTNRIAITDVGEKDTVLVRPNQTADVILPVIQSGIYPLHTHYVPGVTANGVYANPYGGGLILMSAS
jgi:FtsP/CotA-like multicopper oxidase with cupredoxin domain